MASTPTEGGLQDEAKEVLPVQAAETAAPEADPHVTAKNDTIRSGTGLDASDTLEKLTADASLEEMAAKIPEVGAMVGMDQRSDYHSLTLDAHTAELVRNLAEDPFIQGHPKRDIILLAGKLHDTGKASPDGQQVHPRDPEKRQYVGHEKESARMAEGIIDKHFVGLDAEDKALVIGLARLHAAALTLVQNFTTNNQPKGKTLGIYDDFIAKVEAIPVQMSLEEKMKIVFAFNRADKLGGWNMESPEDDPKVQSIKEETATMLEGLEELHKALPALIEAVNRRRLGQRELDEKVPKDERKGNVGAGITHDEETGKYSLTSSQEKAAPAAMDGKQIGLIMQNLDSLGVPKEQRGVFAKALREGGIPGLGKARLGKYIGAVKKLLAEQ